MKVTGVKKDVLDWLYSYAETPETQQSTLEDLLQHGCISGMVGHLIYYHDTNRFYNKHRKEIFEMVEEFCRQTGETLQDFLSHANNFPMTKQELANETFVMGISGLIRKNKDIAEQIKNWFAWFAFEEMARQIYTEIYEEV